MAKTTPAIALEDLDFSYGTRPVFERLSLTVPMHARCLLLGANGVGKSTLLRILAGKHLVKPGSARVLGQDPFSGDLEARELGFIGPLFPMDYDIGVDELIESQKQKHEARWGAKVSAKQVEEVLEVLDVDPAWRMHQVSSGQRRRVDLLLSLLHPPKLLLLDEATADLDLVGRQALLNWMKKRTVAGKMTVILATHILDAMDRWATHVAFLAPRGLFCMVPIAKIRREFPGQNLFTVCERWMRQSMKGR